MNANLVPSKYTTAIFTIILTVVAAFQAAIVGGLTLVETLQLLALGVGAVVTYYAPLLEGRWAAGLKVFGAVIGAVLIAAIDVISSAVAGTNPWNVETITLIFFAGINALAAQYGVDRRVDSAKAGLTDPKVPNAEVYAVDPPASNVALKTVTATPGVVRGNADGFHGE